MSERTPESTWHKLQLVVEVWAQQRLLFRAVIQCQLPGSGRDACFGRFLWREGRECCMRRACRERWWEGS